MNRFLIVTIFLLAILTLGCVSAADENQTDIYYLKQIILYET